MSTGYRLSFTRRALWIAVISVAALVGWWRLHSSSELPALKLKSAAESREAKLTKTSSDSPLAKGSDLQPIRIEAAEPLGNLRLEGQVVDSEERPVSGARVFLGSSPRREAQTERNGTFAFEQLQSRVYAISATSGRFAAGPIDVRVGPSSEPIILVLKSGAAIEVKVLSAADRRPIGDALVTVAERPDLSARTDSKGQATVEGLGPSQALLVVSAAGYAEQRQSISVGFSDRTLPAVFLLRSGAEVSGSVVDEMNGPVKDARVEAVAVGDLPHARSDVLSDADGHWRVPGLPAGTFRLTAIHSQFLPASSELITLDGRNAPSAAVLVLKAGKQLSGSVVDKRGAPVPFASVEAQIQKESFAPALRRQAFCDSEGQFQIKGLSAAPIRLTAQSERATSRPVVVDPNDEWKESPVRLVLDLDEQLSGVVIAASGEPIAQAQVVAVPDSRARAIEMSDDRGGSFPTELTNSAGRFRFQGLAAGEYQLRASRASSLRPISFWLRKPVIAKSGDSNVRILLPEDSGLLKGRVQLTDGTAPASFSITLSLSPSTSFSDAQGQFSLAGIPPGEHSLKISGANFVTKLLPNISVAADQETDLGIIQVERGRVLTGRVIRGDGNPMKAATVAVGTQLLGTASHPIARWRASTEQDGTFSLPGLPDQELVVLAEHLTEGRSAVIKIPPGSKLQPIELKLQPPGTLEGIVTTRGAPAADALVVALPQGQPASRFIVSTQPDGRYRFDKLAPGTYQVSGALHPTTTGLIRQAVMVTLPEAEAARADIEIDRGSAPLSVRVLEQDGRPIPVAMVYLTNGGTIEAATGSQLEAALAWLSSGQTRIDVLLPNKPLVFTDLSPGPYALCAVAVRGDINDPEVIHRVQTNAGSLPAACTPIQVSSTGAQQYAELRMPPESTPN